MKNGKNKKKNIKNKKSSYGIPEIDDLVIRAEKAVESEDFESAAKLYAKAAKIALDGKKKKLVKGFSNKFKI